MPGDRLTWTCHACGDERPDQLIGVHQTTEFIEGTDIVMTENVRYCVDRPDCARDARLGLGELGRRRARREVVGRQLEATRQGRLGRAFRDWIERRRRS